MNRVLMFLLAAGWILFTSVASIAQNWIEVGDGLPRSCRCMYSDTDYLYVGMQSVSSNSNSFRRWDNSMWDSLGTVCEVTDIFAMTKFQNELIISGGCNIAKLNGSNWISLGSPSGTIWDLTVFNNELIAVGLFDSIGNTPANWIAKWDGNTWETFDTTHWYGGAISAAIVYQGDLYIAGNMWNDDLGIDRLARWDGVKWNPVGDGIHGGITYVGTLEEYNGDLYMGGMFRKQDGNPSDNIARWNGTEWKDIGGGVYDVDNGDVRDMVVHDGYLYAAGLFSYAGGVPAQRIAKWDGQEWCAFGDTFYYNISCLGVYHNQLYIAGGFIAINSDTMHQAAKWVGGNYTDTCGALIGVEEILENDLLKIYPNPANDILTIEVVQPSKAIYTIYNLTGSLLQNGSLTQKKEIDVSGFVGGVYVVHLQTEFGEVRKKFVKQ